MKRAKWGNDMTVHGFSGEYAFLSNYYPSQVGMDGIDGPTVEHVFQAMKSASPEERARIASSATPDEAKQAAGATRLRPDWGAIRIPVMECLIREKFFRHDSLRERLLATGDRYLEETNHWGDTFWGVCEGKGENHLGKTLMKIRAEIRETGGSDAENRRILESLLREEAVEIVESPFLRSAPFPLEPRFNFDKIEGMLLGLAIGDSLGNRSESMTPHDRAARYGVIRDYLPNWHADMRPVGLPSDDTQLAFWTLESMLDEGGFNPESVARLFSSGRQIFGLGGSVGLFLQNMNQHKKPWHKSGPPSAGNGALMRIAPMIVPHCLRPSSALWVNTVLCAMITHNDTASISSCVAFVKMLWELVSMTRPPDPLWWLDTFTTVAREFENGTDYRQRRERAGKYLGPLWGFTEDRVSRAFNEDRPCLDACEEWGSGAYLLETVPSVLYICMKHGDDFEEGLVRAVNDTKDNDTAGAIVGAALGALHGKKAIPKRWLEGLPGRTTADDDGFVYELIVQAKRAWGPPDAP
jgi:ribA/ribD-fused uncharacterized protein